MGSEIDKKLDTSNENDEIINLCNKEASRFEHLNSEIPSQSTLSHKFTLTLKQMKIVAEQKMKALVG